MKKILSFAAIVAAIVAFSSCKSKVDLTPYVSQIRSDIFRGESENYAVTSYLETKERPLVADGKASGMLPAIVVRLTVKGEIDETLSGAKVTFTVDKEYSALFTFRPESDVYVASCYTDALPQKALTVTVSAGGTEENVELFSIAEGIASPLKALNAASAANDEFFRTEEFSSMKFEINIRLLEDDGRFFYYVGFVTKDETYATLVSADGEKVLTKRTVKN